ncbi:hypothetical protein OK016_29945 [Vibrio chagasii]|nr:hypothetical protein [Vibrio chagasii]
MGSQHTSNVDTWLDHLIVMPVPRLHHRVINTKGNCVHFLPNSICFHGRLAAARHFLKGPELNRTMHIEVAEIGRDF